MPSPGRLERALVATNRAIVIALMASMAVLVFANVVSRYLFNHSIIWVEELTQFQMIWVAYLGAGLALREGRHVAVDTLQDLLPSGVRRALRNFVALLMAAFAVMLVVLGFQIASFTWSQETPVMGLPTGATYLAVPLGAAAFALHLFLFWRGVVEGQFETPADPAPAHDDEAFT